MSSHEPAVVNSTATALSSQLSDSLQASQQNVLSDAAAISDEPSQELKTLADDILADIIDSKSSSSLSLPSIAKSRLSPTEVQSDALPPVRKKKNRENKPVPVESEVAESSDSEEANGVDSVSDGRQTFRDLNLPPEICSALAASGYEYPTAIQAATIPAIAEGRDVLGQAQTGTGKTAAFALPLLSRINVENPATQVLVLTPTRELAIQVSESFQKYSQHMRGLRVAPIYGGQAYATQIHALQRGVHVVVGTPGRVMDHMRENRLRIDTLQCLVLDEADEMLRMGFVDDVQWILDQSPAGRQIALFSATMPNAIREIADKHLKNPHVISIDSQQRTAETIRQRFVMVEHRSKFEALLRILEGEEHEGIIIFVKTRLATAELADNLTKMGHNAVALNGDIAQAQRERTIDQLKEGVFDILVATDVAARGLDVQRISHVFNYDLPVDSEAYVHRIGRTGRAGRSGEAIVFIAPRQRGFLREIDRAAGQMIEPMAIPTAKEINSMRTNRFKTRIAKICEENATPSPQFTLFEKLIEECIETNGGSATKIAAALAMQIQGNKPFLVEDADKRSRRRDVFEEDINSRGPSSDRRDRNDRSDTSGRDDRSPRARKPESASLSNRMANATNTNEMERFRVEVGKAHGVRPGNLVGAIANEAGLEASHIGQIAIFDEYSTVDLPSGMPREVFKVLGRAWVVGRQLRISKLSDHANSRPDRKRRSKQLN